MPYQFTCARCGTQFSDSHSTRKYCSRECARLSWVGVSRRPATAMNTRLWQKVEKSGDCWEWMGYKDKDGYGHIWDNDNGSAQLVHRVSWQIHHGPIPDGLQVLHDCDNPSCVNPSHLFIGTQQDNMADMDMKQRRGSVPGELHPNAVLTEEDVRQIRSLYENGDYSESALVSQYGISRGAIRRAAMRQSWKHLD